MEPEPTVAPVVDPAPARDLVEDSKWRCYLFEKRLSEAAGQVLVTGAEYRQVLVQLLYRSLNNDLRNEWYPDPEVEQEGK